MTIWQCRICGFVYEEALGMPEHGIAPGTPWGAVPPEWNCPDCGMAKADFDMVAL
ncbi:rubredoxin [Cupriavidus sp. TMH.W2]|uniref:rubredoxin n=1 Tax=Cupriavidus sp. TMH.W2 TaxID=3434465 RepID=UPI003D782090